MRVLIVGCGYVGTPLGAALAQAGHEVHGLRRSETHAGELRNAGIQPLIADITSLKQLETLPCAYDWVVNCVSSSGGGAADYRTVYFEGMRNLLSWLSRSPPKKFIYTSSTSVYGQNDGSIVTEECSAEPEAETSRVLIETEKLLLQSPKVPGIVLRLAGIYGPNRGYWFKQFMAGEATISGEGGRVLNMVHRDDVAGAIIATMERGKLERIYNVVDDEPVTQLDCFQWLAERTGKPIPPLSNTSAAHRKRGTSNKRVSNARLKQELNYRFQYPTFREGFAAISERRSDPHK